MKPALAIALALVLALALSSPAAAQGYYRRYPPPGASLAFQAMVNTMIFNALRPRYQPPPQPVYAPPPARYAPQPQPQAPLTREAWRKAILNEAAKFCDQFPDDEACVMRKPEGPPQ